MELSFEQRQAAESLAIRAKLARRCNAPNCENLISRGEEFEDGDLEAWLKEREESDDDVAEFNNVDDAAEAIRTVVGEAPDECDCALGS